jgi:DnaJ family protein C protein 13
VCSDQNAEVELLELIASSTVTFLQSNPTLTDYFVALGYIGKIFKLAESKEAPVCVSAVRILREVAASRPCVESMGPVGLDPIASLMTALATQGNESEFFVVIMDTMERLITRSSDRSNIVKFVVTNKLIQKLLSMLETGMAGCAQPAAARAIVVKVIKAAVGVNDPVYGPAVALILEANPIWLKYKDQSHDMFLTGQTFGGYLTGPRAQPVLSLAAPPASMNDQEPPPMD